jgi:hypothetical protein
MTTTTTETHRSLKAIKIDKTEPTRKQIKGNLSIFRHLILVMMSFYDRTQEEIDFFN